MHGHEFYTLFEKHQIFKPFFDGVFCIDTLPKSIKYRHFLICNTDFSSGSGKHWICFLNNSKRKSEIEIFDSLGIDEEKIALLKKYCFFKNVIFNQSQFQSTTSDTCGSFVFYFIIERLHNLDLEFDEFIELFFDANVDANESKIKLFTYQNKNEHKT